MTTLSKTAPTTRGRSGSDSSMASEASSLGAYKPGKYPSKKISKNRSFKTPVSESDSSPEDGDDENGGEDEDDDSDEEPDEIAPSAGPVKRGHQTGLSMSLSNTSLGKRGRSPGSADIEERPTSKMSKTDGDPNSSDDDEDDDAYNAVNDISNSEEEVDVEEAEEAAIIDSEEDVLSTFAHHKRESVSSMGSILGFMPDQGSAFGFPPATFFDEQMASIDRRGSVLQQAEHDDSAPTRRVRFAEEVEQWSGSNSTTESEDEAPLYPDLFVQRDSLAPDFREILDQKDDVSSDGEGSYWDFENDNRVIEELDGSGSETGSSGYETDEGETTDEEVLPPRTAKLASISRLQDTGKMKPPPTPTTTPIRRANGACKGPVMGEFLIDDNKPVAVLDGHGTHLLFYPAPRDRRQQSAQARAKSSSLSQSLVPTAQQSESESDIGFTLADPMLSSPATSMVTGFQNGRHGTGYPSMNNEIVGPAEAFYPFVSMDSTGDLDMEDEDMFFDEEMFSEGDLNIEDFINFDDESSDDDGNGQSQQQKGEQSSTNTTAEDEEPGEQTPRTASKFTALKPRSPSTPTPSNSLLHHFDKGVVSSFRRNADRHKTWTRSPIAAGIKGGRFDIANTPISPMRRRKGSATSPASQARPSSTAGAASRIGQSTFGGPVKKRIQNANQNRKNRKSSS